MTGLWVGKVDDRELYLTVDKVSGTELQASANLRNPEGWAQLVLVGTWNEKSGTFRLAADDGTTLNGTLDGGRMSGTAVLTGGSAPMPWSVSRR
jgi:hypothetical protein